MYIYVYIYIYTYILKNTGGKSVLGRVGLKAGAEEIHHWKQSIYFFHIKQLPTGGLQRSLRCEFEYLEELESIFETAFGYEL